MEHGGDYDSCHFMSKHLDYSSNSRDSFSDCLWAWSMVEVWLTEQTSFYKETGLLWWKKKTLKLSVLFFFFFFYLSSHQQTVDYQNSFLLWWWTVYLHDTSHLNSLPINSNFVVYRMFHFTRNTVLTQFPTMRQKYHCRDWSMSTFIKYTQDNLGLVRSLQLLYDHPLTVS